MRYSPVVASVAGIMLLVSCPLGAQELAPNFTEGLYDELPVGADVIAGVLIGSAHQRMKVDALTITVPSSSAGQLCVELQSIDGVYHASFFADLTMFPSRPLSFTLQTEYGELFEAEAVDIAVRATTAPSCDVASGQHQYLPVSWAKPEQADTISVFVNTGRNRAVLLIPAKQSDDGVSTNPSDPIPCNEIPRTKLVTYDAVCVFKMQPHLDLAGTRLQIRHGTTVRRPIAVPILID